MGIQVCIILWMNFDYKENGRKKRFSCKSKASISWIPMSRTWLCAQSQKEHRLLRESKFDTFDGKLWLWGKWRKEKHSLPNIRINILYPNEMSMVRVPITKRMEIMKSIKVCPLSQWTLIIRKMAERKAFLAKSKPQCRVSQWDEHDWGANNKKNGDY